MKRIAIRVAALSAAVALFLLLWRAAVGPSPEPLPRRDYEPSARAPAPPRRPSPPPERRAPPPAPESPAAPEKGPSAGAIRIFASENGRGQAGVRITLTDAEGRIAAAGTSEFDGYCVLSGLAPGEWTVSARHPKFLPAEMRARVEAGLTTELGVELRQGGRAYGTVTDSAGRPLPGVTVSVLRGDTKRFLSPPLNARTDAAGAYSIEGIPLTELALQFHSERHKPLLKEGMIFRYPGDAHEVDATLEEGSVISGRVVDEAGVPIEGASVTAGNEHATAVLTDLEGRFVLYGLGEGGANLSASARGYGTGYLRGIRPGTGPVEIRLVRAGGISGRAAADNPPSSFVVILSRQDSDFGREIRTLTMTIADAKEGRFSLPEVAPGAYWVEIEAEGYETAERPQVIVHPGQVTSNVLVNLRRKE